MDTEDTKQFEKTASNCLKPGMILLVSDENSKKYDYIKIDNMSTVKPGKHGAAKVVINGSNIVNNKNHKYVITSGSKATTVKLQRIEYRLMDISDHSNEICMRPNKENDFESVSIDANELDEKDVNILKKCFYPECSSEITFILVSAPGLKIIEEIRKSGKLIQK